ncbi:hypothetical protein HPB47_015710, partial [Ixodes persulcatus]
MAAPLEPFSAQAGQKRFTIVEDILLLREVLAMNPFVNSSRWDTVAANLNEALGRNFSVRGVRDRCDLLLGLFKRDDHTNVRKRLQQRIGDIVSNCKNITFNKCPPLDPNWEDKLDQLFSALPADFPDAIPTGVFQDHDTDIGFTLGNSSFSGLEGLKPDRPYETFCRDSERVLQFSLRASESLQLSIPWTMCSGLN